ncbi:MAG TPA: pyruvate carboxylase subunit B [Proteobacteria bacterium]|nr:pyruvate carboxylase subunit B [Pseudomonadota bacterium]
MAEDKGKPVKITDTTLRDAHQSLLATRLRTEDMEIIAPLLDQVGFHSVEMWGGATFDVMHRFLGEDPWERPKRLKKLMPNTPFQMLLRGQNLVGYRHYPDDVVEAFVEEAAEAGIDIFRVFDALNDERNFEAAFRAIKKVGKHIQGSISYTLTQRKLGGPVFNLDYYVKKAKTIESMGADSLCIKDMAGLISPDDAYELVKALKEEVRIPIQLHCHATSGMACMAYIKAIEAGVDVIDCACAPLSMRNAQPAVEPFLVALEGTERDPKLPLDVILKIDKEIEKLMDKYSDLLKMSSASILDVEVLLHQIPGGMTSNLLSQLKEADALDKLDDVHAEVPRVRKELGYPPLVTPTSQIVGVQAVLNVLFGRYKMVTDEVKDYMYGLYGKPPAPVDAELQKKILADYPKGQTPITCRPADLLEPEMEKLTKEVEEFIGRKPSRKEVLIYALYPTTGKRFLRVRYGLEEPPKEWSEVPAKKEEKEEAAEAPAPAAPAQPQVPQVRTFRVNIGYESFDVVVQETTSGYVPQQIAPAPQPVAPTAAQPSQPRPSAATPAAQKPARPPEAVEGDAITAPMPGTIIKYEVQEGERVKKGQTLLILEAMKMENRIVAPKDGVVKQILKSAGDHVKRGETLIVIG